MMASYSIQGVDFSTRQEGAVSTDVQMVDLFNSYDWASEHAMQAKLEQANEENCPAGFNIVREPFVFLHLCPNLDDTVLTHCIHTASKKRLGLFKTTVRTDLFVERLPHQIAVQTITKFLAADENWLLNNLNEG